MPKPKKERLVSGPPPVSLYKPQGIPASMLETIILHIDEFEALRLVDREKLDLTTAAELLGVSRATCGRIVEEAHGKVAEALTGGKSILIRGGNYRITGQGRHGGHGTNRGRGRNKNS